MSALREARRSAFRLRAATLAAAVGGLGLHLALVSYRSGSLDLAVAAVDGALVLAAAAGAYVYIGRLTRERERRAAERLLWPVALSPHGIADCAAEALDALVRGGVCRAGIIALTTPDGARLEPAAAIGLPEGWLERAPDAAIDAFPPLPVVEHGDSTGPWSDPIRSSLGPGAWVATVPLGRADEVLGMLVLAAERRGVLADRELLRRLADGLTAALDQAALYEATYEREQTLEAADARRREFMAAMAHEVRTPLTSISAFAELLAEEAPAHSEPQLLDSLVRAVERLGGLIDDLLELGQVHEATVEVSPRPVDVAEAIREAEAVIRPALMLREQTFHLEAPEVPATALADRRHLQQVLLNLLSNANRHTPAGGDVVARVRVEGEHVHVEVEDSGPGIDPAERSLIFEPYYRTRRPGAVVPGSGLGLAVARRLVELQGGEIWVDDTCETGARFCLRLPVATSAARRDDASGESVAGEGRPVGYTSRAG